MVKLTSIAAGV
ncbi:Pau3p, partial [Saccharomyces cerevisiae YJM1248]